jgi:dihydroorotase
VSGRREFLRSFVNLGTGLLASNDSWLVKPPQSGGFAQDKPRPRSTSQDTGRECDLVIKGGTVIDPSQHLHAVLDVAVKDGKILEVSRDFPEGRAAVVVSAKDRIVTPGFVDIHAHVFEGLTIMGVNADLNCLPKGTTTVVDAGSAGWPMIAGFRKYVINTSMTRVYALLDICAIGSVIVDKGMSNLAWVEPELTERAAEQNKPAVIGIMIQLGDLRVGSKELELECLRRGREAAEACHLPMMVRGPHSASSLPPILKILRKGDVWSQMYTPGPNGILDPNGKILPEVREARERGVLFDVGHALVHFPFDGVDKCLQQDFPPDTISSCMIRPHPYKSYEVTTDLPTIVSEFLLLGLDLDKTIEMVTAKPAQVFNYGVELGTLRPGRDADVSVFELREGNFTFTDFTGQKRTGRQRLFPVATVRSGSLFEIIEQFHP